MISARLRCAGHSNCNKCDVWCLAEDFDTDRDLQTVWQWPGTGPCGALRRLHVEQVQLDLMWRACTPTICPISSCSCSGMAYQYSVCMRHVQVSSCSRMHVGNADSRAQVRADLSAQPQQLHLASTLITSRSDDHYMLAPP